ncbi:MAG TPA: class I SAM-dependent methyltransferase [Armatimonadota bacterium]|nr:class I SAM-dependent methyltransferase [Armatimonadota bacterium]
MRSSSQYHQGRSFSFDFREGRLKRCIGIIEKLAPGVLLDLGCSTGDWASYWAGQGWKCLAVDINTDAVEAARAKGIDARVCDLNSERLPFEDNSVDLVFAGELIEHLLDTDGFLREVHRVLKKGGHLLLTTPNLSSFQNRLRLLLGFYPMWINYRFDEGAGHVRAYTAKVLKSQLAEHSFSVIKHTGNWVPFLPQEVHGRREMAIPVNHRQPATQPGNGHHHPGEEECVDAPEHL